jgi:predicted nucleic acid-binding protein
MSGFLLDTNVVSELVKPKPNSRVMAWVDATPEQLIHLSVITIGEIRRGIDLLPASQSKRVALQSWLERDLQVRFAGRILTFDLATAERWGSVEAAARKNSVRVPTIDAQLAATALQHNLTFVTRNTNDVRATGATVFNPWEE